MIFTGIRGTQTVAAKTVLVIIATATIRPRIQKLTGKNIGTIATDSNVELTCSRITTTGTTTAVTLNGSDPNDPAATLIAGSNASVEPTYTANTLQASLIYNPRGQDLWQALTPAAEIILPATASNGLGVLLVTLGGGVTVVAEAQVQQ